METNTSAFLSNSKSKNKSAVGRTLRTFSAMIVLSTGWRRLVMAFLAGALSAFSQAPYHLAPLLFLTFPIFVFLLDGAVTTGRRGLKRLRPAAAVGWWFGFGYFLSGLWWIGTAFLVEAETFGWLMPFAVLALPAGLALFTMIGALLARLLWVDSPFRIFSLSLGLTSAELLRGMLFTGFPWNLFGQAVAFTDITAQAASLVGVYGLTGLGIIVFAAPAVLFDDAPGTKRARLVSLAIAAALLFGTIGYGVFRLSQAGSIHPSSPTGLKLRLVQAAIDQAQKWTPAARAAALGDYIVLSREGGTEPAKNPQDISIIVWPETALPFFLTEEPAALGAIAAFLAPNSLLITGAPRIERNGSERRIYNSAYVVDGSGEIITAYDKSHLTPFGEYLPFQTLLEALGLRQLVHGIGGFTPGPGIRTLSLPRRPDVGLLICYEIIFPGQVINPTKRPAWLLNLTNDAWFGRTPGPYQHFDLARLRAVEEGLPVVRAANSGISGVIDAYGRKVARLGLEERGVLDAILPQPIDKTIYSKYFPHFLLTYYTILVTLIAAGRRKHSRKR